MLELNGVQFAQSLALLTYAGKLAQLYPMDPLVAAEVGRVPVHALFFISQEPLILIFRSSLG